MSRNPSLYPCKNKPLTCSSLMARSFKLHGRLCQLCGCFFVRDIFSGAYKQARKVPWKSWYTLHSCACVGLLAWVGIESFVAWTGESWKHEEQLKGALHLTLHIMLFLRIGVNYLCMNLGSSKLISFYQRASVYEKRAGLLPCECCSTGRIFWSDVRTCGICFLYSVAVALTEPRGPDPLKDPLTEAIHISRILLLTLVWLVYDLMHSVSLKSSSHAICQYIDHELHVLSVFRDGYGVGFNRYAAAARRLEEVRLNVFTMLQLKRDINDIWTWSLVVSSVYAIVVPCVCVHEACYAAFAPEERSGLALYALFTSYDFATIAHASQSLVNKFRKLKDACRTVRSSCDVSVQYQIQRLHDSINPDDMAFKGADFFTLEMSLMVSMAASVVTYAVILQQTTQSLKRSRGSIASQF